MSEIRWVRSHVERLLQDEWDACRVAADCDGDYPFRRGTAACWVSVLETEPVLVRVWAHAAFGVRSSAKLLREINELNSRASSAKLFWSQGVVVVSQTLCPWELNGPVLAQALAEVGGVADEIGLLVAGMFGGSTPYPAELGTDEEVA